MTKPSISIVIPAYNESNDIADNINIVLDSLSGFSDDYEIIIIDDGSDDFTYKSVVEGFDDNNRVVVCRNHKNMGKGAAIRKGIYEVTKEYTVFLDADLDLAPFQIRNLFSVMDIAKADVVIGSKLHEDSLTEYPFSRRIMSLCYYLLIKVLFGLPCRDTQTGLKLFKTSALKSIMPFEIDKFAYDLEILVRLNDKGYTIAECPIILQSRRTVTRIGTGGASKVLYDTFRIWYTRLMRQ